MVNICSEVASEVAAPVTYCPGEDQHYSFHLSVGAVCCCASSFPSQTPTCATSSQQGLLVCPCLRAVPADFPRPSITNNSDYYQETHPTKLSRHQSWNPVLREKACCYLLVYQQAHDQPFSRQLFCSLPWYSIWQPEKEVPPMLKALFWFWSHTALNVAAFVSECKAFFTAAPLCIIDITSFHRLCLSLNKQISSISTSQKYWWELLVTESNTD